MLNPIPSQSGFPSSARPHGNLVLVATSPLQVVGRGVGASVGGGVGAGVGGGVGADIGAGVGTFVGAGIGMFVGTGVGTGVDAGISPVIVSVVWELLSPSPKMPMGTPIMVATSAITLRTCIQHGWPL